MPPELSQVTHGHVSVNGLRFHYVETGKGPLVLLLHGFPENWWSWRYQFQPLVDSGFRVVAPDLRGYDGSDKGGPYDLETLASDVYGLIQALGEENAHLVGHDLGGAVAWHVAATRPLCVERLVVINCPHPAQLEDALRPSRELLKRAWPKFSFPLAVVPEMDLLQAGPELIEQLYAKSAQDPSHFSHEEIQPFIDGMAQPGAVKAMLGWYRTSFKQAIARRGNAPQYAPIGAETLLIWSRSEAGLKFDELVPGTENHVPKLQLATLGGAGHYVHAEKPQRVNDVMIPFLMGGEEAAMMGGMEVMPSGKTSFSVVLASAGENKIAVIREVRNITGLSLKEARELVEAAPSTLKVDVSSVEAARIRQVLSSAGAVVQLT
ncbi:MAG: ribosomal protein L7/L12 [Myxococcaceae bacterium]